ncbi:unnamed protein product [Lymnaea stagnalis]|uniref:sphingomyelin phosphodiesterase n=1 Tax=Lymnaea stagnalis TaxID=6523 RepID=A0AAV2I9X9_LYMST
MATSLKVLTLNCWGLPFPVICKNRQERICAIGDYINDNGLDIVILEEIWVKSDFQKLRQKLQLRMPFSHYFYSGTIGSGICVFSKHLISETSYHRFHLNGHPHKILHGDWFGGKGVGLCKIQIQEKPLEINVYATHFHAEYNPAQDEYEAHRLAQAFELSQFIRNTSRDCDMIIVAGDLNTGPTHLGYKVITQHADLKDAWLEKNNTVTNEHGGTCDVPGNTYTGNGNPEGDRIDYIMYSTKNGYEAAVTDCIIGIGKISNLGISYSDHEAVIASISVFGERDSFEPFRKSPLSRDVKECLHETLLVLDKGVSQCLSEEKFFQLVVFVLSLILYAFNAYVDIADYNGGIIVAFTMASTKLLLAIAIGFSFWTALIVKRAEFHGLIACKEDIMKLLGV